MHDGAASAWVGTIGERTKLTLTARSSMLLDTQYGVSTLITYSDEDGNVIRWFRSGEHEVELEQTATYEASVKKHVEYEGICETHVVRVKPYVSPEDKKALGKLRKAAKAEYDRLKGESDDAWEAASSLPHTDPLWQTYYAARKAAEAAHDAWKGI